MPGAEASGADHECGASFATVGRMAGESLGTGEIDQHIEIRFASRERIRSDHARFPANGRQTHVRSEHRVSGFDGCRAQTNVRTAFDDRPDQVPAHASRCARDGDP